jgi:SNF2 family DNA or RNA helicase
VKNKFKRKHVAPDDCVRRLVNDIAKRLQRAVPSFRTVVIDEAHFLKNNLAYWGISGLLLSLHCERCIPMSGTPYNNGPQDLAACMAYIDVGLNSARRGFWVKALAGGAETSVRHALKEWNKDFLVRRKKDEVLTKLLGKKTIETKVVEQHPDEIFL